MGKSEYNKIYKLIIDNKDTAPNTLDIILTSYLSDPDYINKNIVLQCMADNLYILLNDDLVNACLKLMHSKDVLTRNCVTRLLFTNLQEIKEKALEELKYINEDYVFEILNYVSFNEFIGLG